MFVIMDEISPWPPVNCNDCRNVSCTEAEQERPWGNHRIFAGNTKSGFFTARTSAAFIAACTPASIA